jgi:hypothetical protein
MLNPDSRSIQIPLNNPHFNLMFLSMESVSETKAAVQSAINYEDNDKALPVVKDSSIKAVELSQCATERFFTNLTRCNLSEVQNAFCQRAKTVFSISAVRNSSSFFAPFWACHAIAQELADSLDAIVVDMHQGNIVTTDGELNEQKASNGVPLTAAFLTIKAYPKENAPNRFYLYTEGMTRFGLPELNLPEVPSNLAADGAYLLRSIAQFLWSKLEKIHPEQPCLSMESELEMSAVYCEYGNPAFHAAPELMIPFALEVFNSIHETVLVVRQPKLYDDYYDWLLSVIESVVDHRMDIQRAASIDEVKALPATIAA